MRSINFSKSKSGPNPWDAAAGLLTEYLENPRKADALLDTLAFGEGSAARARAQSLFLGALRHGHRSRGVLGKFLQKKPRPVVEAILLIGGYEIHSSPKEKHPKIVHHAVERAKQSLSRPETSLVNAVLRKLPEAFASIDPDDMAMHLSHPEWLAGHWIQQFGAGATRALLEWNQQTPVNHVEIPGGHVPPGLATTDWPGFYRLPKGSIPPSIRPLLDKGAAYVKDPSTRIAPGLLAPQPGDSVLDLCAAPGGKAFDMARMMEGRGRLVAVDLPCPRMDRLRENLSRLQSQTLQIEILENDVLELDREQLTAPFDAVMLDVPCSNTGVIQRRTDVKWRLRPEDIANCARLQSQLLHSAARFVKPGGRLVYSTCSIEPAENSQVVEDFLASRSGRAFSLESQEQSYPWETGHDGAGACLLVRQSG